MSSLTLYNYWRSGPSYRVRIALALKGVAYRYVGVNLLADEQAGPENRSRNPLGLVPSLELGDGRILTQSPAILEWLEETFPDPPLLPNDPFARAQVRAMAALIGCDVHPLHNLRILRYLETQMGQDGAARIQWAGHWIHEGLMGLESLLEQAGPGRFCFGDTPSLADLTLIPQMLSARRFGLETGRYRRLAEIEANALVHPAFAGAHPERQPDAIS